VNEHADELARIRAEYDERDAGATPERAASPWLDPAYVAYLQGLERSLLRALRETGIDLSTSSVLDVGCGSGYFLHRLSEYGAAAAHGVDLMPKRIAQAHERYPTLDVRQADASQLPFDDGSFDLVTHFTCLSSVLDPRLRVAIAADMWRVLRPGGAIVSMDMLPASWVGRALQRRAGPGGTPTRGLDRGEVQSLFPGRMVWARRPVVSPVLLQVVSGRPLAVSLLSLVPSMRSHLLAVVIKDGS
jgi:ubiquinone/menaquinone biosynthesis C-methylase UbiE